MGVGAWAADVMRTGNVPFTTRAVWYAYAIEVGGRRVGSLTGFNPEASRDFEKIKELYESTGQRFLDVIPGPPAYTIRVDSIQLYRHPLIQVLAGRKIYSIADFREKFNICEYENQPDGTLIERIYEDCIITSYGRTISTGTVYIAERCEIIALRMIGGEV